MASSNTSFIATFIAYSIACCIALFGLYPRHPWAQTHQAQTHQAQPSTLPQPGLAPRPHRNAPANPAQPAARPPCHIVVVGDSLSAAYGLPAEQGWVALLRQRLQQQNLACTVYNASISGDTTAGGKARLPALLASQRPSHMVLALGGNDGLRGLPTTAMQQNLAAMISLAKQQGTRTVLVGMRIPPNYGPQYTTAFANTFATLAKQHNTAWVPFLLEGFANNPKAFQDDGIHPNASAQPTMLNTVWPALLGSVQRHFKA